MKGRSNEFIDAFSKKYHLNETEWRDCYRLLFQFTQSITDDIKAVIITNAPFFVPTQIDEKDETILPDKSDTFEYLLIIKKDSLEYVLKRDYTKTIFNYDFKKKQLIQDNQVLSDDELLRFMATILNVYRDVQKGTAVIIEGVKVGETQ